jgi:YegS/Rv2252/BmrU family lipid kinase
LPRSRPSPGISAKTVFLVNPASANGATGRAWPRLEQQARELGLSGETLHSQCPGELAALARSAAEGGADLLVAVGGDGTVNEIVNGIAGLPGVELAVIARGTGWDFVRTYGIPRRLEEAVAVARAGRTREIDVGRAVFHDQAGTEQTMYFANIASAGMSGAIARRANVTSKALGGKVSYLWATVAVLSRWRSGELNVTVDGERRSARMHDVVVANGRYFGGGMEICPDAEPDDGVFDVLLIGDLTKRDLLFTLPKTYRGSHLPHPKAEVLRGSRVAVDAPTAVPIELDGEQPGTTPASFELVPRALRLRVPG